jgi:hypothetical protein
MVRSPVARCSRLALGCQSYHEITCHKNVAGGSKSGDHLQCTVALRWAYVEANCHQGENYGKQAAQHR